MFKDNLKSLRENRHLTKKQVASGIGVNERAYIAYEYGERDVSTETLCKLADFYHVSVDCLLGRETMPDPIALMGLQTEINEDKVIEQYMQLPEEWRAMLLEVMKRLAAAAEQKKPPCVTVLKHVSKAAAGSGYDLTDHDEWEEIEVTDTPQAQLADFAVEITGDSMLPDFRDGDVVLVQKTPDVPAGKVGLFVQDGKGYIKEKGRDRLISRNKKFPDIFGEVQNVGIVLGIAEVQ